MAGTVVANVLNTDTGLFQTNNAYNGIAKAWVQGSNYGGTSVVSNSFNVSSVTRNSSGNFTINFTTAMPNANYVALGTGIAYSTSDGGNASPLAPTGNSQYGAYYNKTTSAITMTQGTNSNAVDGLYGVAIFGN
jgi:hypothetical protein